MLFSDKNYRRKFLNDYGKDPTQDSWHYMRQDRLDYIRIYDDELGSGAVDQITWDDLNMDDIFLRINHTRSFIGEQVLYHRLHDLDAAGDRDTFEAHINYFDQNTEARLKAEQKLARLGKVQTSYFMPRMLKYLADYKMTLAPLYSILQMLLLLSVVSAIITKLNICITAAIAIGCINLALYVREKGRSEGLFQALSGLYSLIDFSQFAVSENVVPESMVTAELKKSLSELRSLKWRSGYLVSKKSAAQADAQGILSDYLLGITLWDLTFFHHIVKTVKGHEEAVMRLYEFAGEVDMFISIASYRRSMDGYCVPVFTEETSVCAEALRHPLIEDAVPNDAALGNYSMLMGANASGKSTYMKAVAINLILAQTINTCSAVSFRAPAAKVMTSMAIRDDVVSGESYYVREVRYLKRMIDQVESGKPVLLIIDEILKGTNTVERIAASEAVLRYLAKYPCIVLVATHDLELIDRMKDIYEVWHFDTLQTEDGIEFDYRLHRGIGGGTNAIALLSLFGFPEEIVADAKKGSGSA